MTGGTSVTCLVATLSTDGSTPLTNGTPYSIEMEAVNSVGAGASSNSVSSTPYTTPGAPTITTGSSGMIPSSQSLTVDFTAPNSNGGSAITAYQYSTDAGVAWHDRTDGASATSTTMTITALSSDGTTALTNGTTYDVEIRAVNAAGDGPGSDVAAGIPVTAPSAPGITWVTSGNAALGVTFTPGSNGGSAITAYQYSTDGGTTWTATGSLSATFAITALSTDGTTALTNGTPYSVEVRAENGVSGGSFSSPSSPVSGTPATVPTQPVITAVPRGNATISVSFTQAGDGGSTITSDQYSTDGGVTWQTASGTNGPLTITALSTNGTTPIANGTEYPVEIRAVNTVGDSLASSPVEAAPATVPGAPTVALIPGNGVISVATTVTNDGGSAITGVDYSLDDTNWISTGTTSSIFTITGLTNGTTQQVWVRADNAIGDGTPSAPASATPYTVPGAPISVQATNGAGSSVVSWHPPNWNGGSAVTQYTATAYTSSAGTTTAGTPCTTTSTLTCTVTGLTNDTTYYIGVVATNAAGSGVSSSPLVPVTPVALPGAPTINSITPGNTILAVNFTAGSAGGDPITSYQYSLDGGSTWTAASGSTSPIYISGLTNGTSYPVKLEAVSTAGAGAPSNSASATPYTTPNAPDPTTITAVAQGTGVLVSWAAPANNGATISNQTVNGVNDSAYTVTAFNSLVGGTQIGTCTSSGALSCTLNGLPGNAVYYISIQAGNAAGLSPRSSPRVAVSLPGITSAALVGGDVNVAYTGAPTATGGTAPLVWSLSTGSLPAGLGLNTTTGAVTGTPTATGTSNFTLEVTDANNFVATQAESVVIASAPTISSAALGGGDLHVAYTGTPTVSGGTGPYVWSVSIGSLPAGLSLNPSTGAVTGMPTATGTNAFTLKVVDSYGLQATQSESMTIVNVPAFTSSPLGNGEVGVSYAGAPAATGGTGSFTWSVSTGSLPAGLSLNSSTGAVTGTPTTAGSASFTLKVTDSKSGFATQSQTFTITADPTITSAALSGGEVGKPYAAIPTTTGGTTPFAWSVTSGSLPAGLTLNPSTGAVTGTPTANGPFSFILTVTDADAMVASQSESFSIVAAPTITSAVLSRGEVTVHYASAPVVAGGTPSYTWSTSAPLPAGLAINPSTGAVAGTPTAAGTYTFTLVAVDGVGVHATQPESVTVAALPSAVGGGMVNGDVGVSVGHQLTTQGGTGPYAWTLSTGSLPSGVGLSASGVISGVPANAGTFVVTVTVTDALGLVSSEPLTMVVEPTSLNSRRMAVTPDGRGYWIATVGGSVTAYGEAPSLGSMVGKHLNQPIVGIEATSDGKGYWLVASDGGVFAFGDASYFGSEGSHHLNKPIVGMAATPDGQGYWLVASDGGLFTFGNAPFFGSEGSHHLNQPIVGMAATPDGQGYWLVASDGGLFTFGNAPFFGSEGSHHLNQPIVDMAATPDGQGYWMAAADGGVFTFGDAPFEGAEAGHRLNAPVGSIEGTQNGQGYWLLADDGGVFAFGGAAFMGSLPQTRGH